MDLIGKLFDPRMGAIMQLYTDLLDGIDSNTCDCDVCVKLRAVKGSLEDHFNGD